MKKSKIKVVISLMVLLVIMITMNKSYAGMADLTDEMSDTLANEQLTNQQKAESETANKSSNNYLSSLEEEGYRLLPEIDKQIQEYT